MEFSGKYAVVTGAGSGMGRYYALKLAQRGYGIIAVDINSAAIQTLADEIGGQACAKEGSVPFLGLCKDLTQENAAADIAAVIREKALAIEILVNNAGMIVTRPIMDTPQQKLSRIMMLHCNTPLLLCRELAPMMAERGSGYILNISSICSAMNWPIIGMYGNTKLFVKAYSRSLRMELHGSGVSVTTALFGAVDTPLFGFSPKARKVMLRLGVMITAEKAVDRALAAMFKRRKKVIPGILNRAAMAVCPLLPDRLIIRLANKFAYLFE